MKIGIDVGGSHIGVGLIDTKGKIIAKEEKDINNNSKSTDYNERLVKAIIELITNVLNKTKTDIKNISLIGIAIPGTVSKTHIVKAENLHIKDFNITAEINKYFNIPVILRNDAKCAALAEKEYGSLKKCDDGVFLTIGTGVGGAVFLDGKLLRPKKYEGFEIGHMAIERNGLKCNCGREGCFERYASMKAFKDKIQKEFKNPDLTGKEIKEIVSDEKNKLRVENIINEYVENLSIGIANLINIFEPEIVSIGGSFVYFEEIFIEKIKKVLIDKNMLFNDNSMPKFVMAELMNDAGIIGASIE